MQFYAGKGKEPVQAKSEDLTWGQTKKGVWFAKYHDGSRGYSKFVKASDVPEKVREAKTEAKEEKKE